MKRFIGSLICLTLLFGTGCASKTVVGLGKIQFGARTALHSWAGPSLTHDSTTGESRATLGLVSVGVIGRVVDPVQAITLTSQTGDTATVDGQ